MADGNFSATELSIVLNETVLSNTKAAKIVYDWCILYMGNSNEYGQSTLIPDFYRKFINICSEKPFESGTFVIAIFSLFFSVYGIHLADRAQSYTETIQETRRSIVLVGDTGKNEKSLGMSPLQSEMKFLSGKAYFPSEINEGAVPIDVDGEVRWTGSIIAKLEALTSKYMKPVDGHVLISEGGIPIVIYSYYAFEGQVFEDWSLYNLTIYTQINPPDRGGEPTVKFKGLIFGSRLNTLSEEDAIRAPNTIWESMAKQGLGTLNIPSPNGQ